MESKIEHPVWFFTQKLKQNPTLQERLKLTRLFLALQPESNRDDQDLRLGLRGEQSGIAAGVVAWRLSGEKPIPTLVLSGRPMVREAWARLLATYVSNPDLECCTPVKPYGRLASYYNSITNRPVILTRGEYYEGIDYKKLNWPFDILIPDFDWIDRETLQEAIDLTLKHGTILTVVTSCKINLK